MDEVRGEILLREAVPNRARRFGSSELYVPAWVEHSDGRRVRAFFTAAQLTVAEARARDNPEDWPGAAPRRRPWWRRLGR